jgi:hypothetical protein
MKRFFILGLLVLTGSVCALPNPASVYCEQQGGKLKLERTNNHGWIGICIFPDHSYCEEWSFFKKECRPGKFFTQEKHGGFSSR